ncbi:glycine-rich domain-containing protein-like [Leptolyngbya sp. NK1-12]|uniref:Glycine-rich domain-containing protein-like n=1 Tax=Leptolyngbya sp. NK1-12 TaxID=2547451 RepID=A0AA96WKX2_9CYAN|nr:glycine-rich domain-containing protein-like [Leptolyngbya sp. NK1-12]
MPPQLSATDQAFLQRLARIDFGPIAFKLMHPDKGPGWPLAQTTHAIEQYRRFLFLHHRYPTAQLVPSQEIDQVWHIHILDTAKYRQDCQFLFGRFIDHYPYFGLRGEADRQAMEHAFAHTQALFEQCFQEVKG